MKSGAQKRGLCLRDKFPTYGFIIYEVKVKPWAWMRLPKEKVVGKGATKLGLMRF